MLETQSDVDALASLGPEASRLDEALSRSLDEDARRDIWSSAQVLMLRGPLESTNASGATCLALGFVQSGKTTSITALVATAADAGYRVIVALLGGTNLLLNQNRLRLETALGIGTREDYVWVVEGNPSGTSARKRMENWLERGRVVLIPVLKHAGRLNAAADVLGSLPHDVPVLIVDDEADQASLNTAGTNAESKTYEAITELRRAVPRHLYVQYTATPYAPLLLDAADLLSPQFVEFLNPGRGYTGGREFFVDFADRVVRDVPALEEQATKTPPLQLPSSLQRALASFVSGAALLLTHDPNGAPVSMLVHSTARNDVQARYHFLIERQLAQWKRAANEAATAAGLPEHLTTERKRLVDSGATDVADLAFLAKTRFVLREVTLWLVNSTNALNKVDWTVAPIHVLIGGNKLDRGYTVEGLTVTYMNRPTSPQVDTLEQRARAFGYRRDQLPYCQFFSSKKTTRALRDIVYTEYDLRAQLRDHVDSGGSVHTWAREVGLLLPEGMKPTRDAVIQALSKQSFGWHSLRRPVLSADELAHNRELIMSSGLLHADATSYGRLRLRTMWRPVGEVVDAVLRPWAVESYSPSWRHDEIVQALERFPDSGSPIPVILMDESGSPRVRKWDDATGFVNLFQGRDLRPSSDGSFYPGDRAIPDIEENPDQVVVQVHHVVRRGDPLDRQLFTLAVHLGTKSIVRKQ
jgi:hypothetical protein